MNIDIEDIILENSNESLESLFNKDDWYPRKASMRSGGQVNFPAPERRAKNEAVQTNFLELFPRVRQFPFKKKH